MTRCVWLVPSVKNSCISWHLRYIFSPQLSGSAIVFFIVNGFYFLTQSHQRDNLQRNKEKDPRSHIYVAAHTATNKEVIETPLEVRLHI